MRPLRVVGGVGRQGPHQRTVSALGPQAGVDLQRRVIAGGTDERAHLFGHRHRPLHRPRLVDSLGRLADEHHVGIGAVTLFLTAEPTHPDHRDHPRRRVRPGVVLNHGLQRALQHRHPHRRQGRAHCPDVEHAEQVRRCHPGQFPTAQGSRGGDGAEWIAMAPGRGHQRPRHDVGIDVEQLGSGGTVGVLTDHLRCPHQQLRHERRRAQHAHQPFGDRTLITQRAQVPTLLSQCLADPPIGQQPAIRVGSVGEPIKQSRQQHRLDPATAAT